MDYGMCIHDLFVWSHLNFLYTTKWITFLNIVMFSLIFFLVLIIIMSFSDKLSLVVFQWCLNVSKSSQVFWIPLNIPVNFVWSKLFHWFPNPWLFFRNHWEVFFEHKRSLVLQDSFLFLSFSTLCKDSFSFSFFIHIWHRGTIKSITFFSSQLTVDLARIRRYVFFSKSQRIVWVPWGFQERFLFVYLSLVGIVKL